MQNQKLEINQIVIYVGEIYKIYGESKLYWLVNPLKIVDEFTINQDVVYVSMCEYATYRKFSNVCTNKKEKILKSRVNYNYRVSEEDIDKFYYYRGCNTCEIEDRDKFIQAKTILYTYVLACSSGIIKKQCENGNKESLKLRADLMYKLKDFDKKCVKSCFKQFEKDDYKHFYKLYKELRKEF